MRIAFFSPMPPTKSGIADYSSALVESLSRLAEVTVFTEKPVGFRPGDFDITVYQLGNNPYHAFVYEQALQHPGVVVMHEANLHHLIADLTIKRNDWDAYLREVEFDGGKKALAYAQRVRALEVGPDYKGVPMLRRILESARGVIVHSHCVEQEVRAAGYAGPIAVIPHGAWIPEADRLGYRQRLGVEPAAPLIGIFGFLKPYKRIAESLRAFQRVLRTEPAAKMILVGEPHPDFPIESLIHGLGIGASVRLLGYTPIEDFVGYISACDIVLNLRFPTVGESSGTLLRSLGLGKAVVVSNIGSFAEFPDEICLKTPVDATEEDILFEYLNLLISRPDLRTLMGDRAKRWVVEECNWDLAAARYLSFLEAVRQGTEWTKPVPIPSSAVAAVPASAVESVPPGYVLGWAVDQGSRDYVQTHLTRLAKTLELTPRAEPGDRILEMGAYLQITPALKTRLGYSEVRGCYYGPAGKSDHRSVTSADGETFSCDVDLFDAEKDPFPYPDEHFATVLCCELIEHLPSDPMHMMGEINRILKPGGRLVLTTPNIGSVRAIAAIVQGYHPGFFPAYIRPSRPGEEVEARHNREYTPREIAELLRDSGFEVSLLETGEFKEEPKPEHIWVLHMLEQYQLSTEQRGDGIYAVGVKRRAVQSRYPAWLYSGGA
ncbi:MAG TPA: methyltransferase domain-containing protein [Bryobacteraceae bacterium]|nr:methyltransferase domain-containing protein [Bryobacteraceae bacterium]